MPKKGERTTSRKTKGRTRKWWTDAERTAIMTALVANNDNVRLTSEQTGCPIPTIHSWRNGWRCPDAMQLYNEHKGDLASAIEKVAWQITAKAPERVETAPLNHLMSGLATAVDRMRLLRGESTTIGQNTNQNLNIDLVELVKQLKPDERRQLEALISAAFGSQGERPTPSPEDGEGGRPETELPSVHDGGIPGSGPLDSISG